MGWQGNSLFRRGLTMTCAEMSVVESLVRKVEMMIEYDSIDSLTSLMRELVEAKKEAGLSGEERRKIYALGEQVEKRVIELLQKEADDVARDWRDDADPRGLRWQRDNLRGMAKEAVTAKLREAFRSCAGRIQELLNQGSEELAASMVSKIETAIAHAEEMLTNPKIPDGDIRATEATLSHAERHLQTMKETPHVFHVGLPRVAKKRNLLADALLAGFSQRVQDARIALFPLQQEADYAQMREEERRRVFDEKTRRDMELRMERQTRERRGEEIERIVVSIERRSKEAGMVARKFLEYVSLGNAGAAKACLYQIQRHDGGYPRILQEEYQRILQRNTHRCALPI